MSGKPSQSSTQIIKQSPTTLAPAAHREKQTLIANYLNDFATIANRVVTPQLLQIFEDALSDLPVSRLRAGLDGWLKNGDRFPWPSNIREEAEL